MLLAEVDFSNTDTFQPAKVTNIAMLMNVILPLLTLGAAFVFLAICLYAGFNIITGGDNPEKIKKSQQTLGFAVVGIFIVLCSYIAVKLIGVILGVNNILPV